MNLRKFSIFWPLILCLVLLRPSALYAEVDENALWSLQFRSVSISEALEKITQTTGIKIITPKQLGDQVITRSYENKTIEHILKDMFRDMNYALVWSYGEKGIDSVRILALDKVGATGAKDSPGAVVKERRPPPRRPIIEREQEDTESEPPSEQVQKEEDQRESELKEEEKESIGSAEELDEEKPIPPKKMPIRSNEGVEEGKEESQSEAHPGEDEESVPSSQPGTESSKGE